MIYYIVDYYDEPIQVDRFVFYNYINYLKFLNYPIKAQRHYLDKLGGSFLCYYYHDPDSLSVIYVAFKKS